MGVEASVTGTLWDGISSLAKAALELIFNKDKTKLKELTEKFIRQALDEGYKKELIDQLLTAAGSSVISETQEKIASIAKDSFDPISISRLIGVGYVKLRPKELYRAIESLQAYALSAGHQNDKTFSTDGRAHLILALIGIIKTTFAETNPQLKIQWLKLTHNFVERIIASDFISTADWNTRMGRDYITFFQELSNLQNTLISSIDHLKKHEILRPALREYIESINTQIDSAQYSSGSVMGLLWREEKTNMAHGRPRVYDLNPPTLIGYFMDAMGCTLVPHKAAQDSTYVWQPQTQEYMEWVIAWSKASPKTLAQDSSALAWPEGYKKPSDEKTVAGNLKLAQFLSAFEDLVNKKRIMLDKDGNVQLYAYQKTKAPPFVQWSLGWFGVTLEPELSPLSAAMPMGLNPEFLTVKKEQAQSSSEFALAQENHRKNILNVEVLKARTMNAILGLMELCDCIEKFLDDYGMVKAAIFLQKLFPSMLTLIDAASLQHEFLINALDQLNVNPEIANRIAKGLYFFRKVADNLKIIKNSTEKAQKGLTTKREDIVSGKISMVKQLEEIHKSLKNCQALFSLSNMLQSEDVESLQEKLKELQDQIKRARPFDEKDKTEARRTFRSDIPTEEPSPPAATAHTAHASATTPDSSPASSHNFSFTDLIESQQYPITALLDLAGKKEKKLIDDSAGVRKLYDQILSSIVSSYKSEEILNSPQIFKLGLHLCKKFNAQKKPEVYKSLLHGLPTKIANIIIGIHNGKKFIFNSQKKEWLNFNLYVESGMNGFFQTLNGQHERGPQAQVILSQVNDTEFFKISVARWPQNFLYIHADSETVKADAKDRSGALSRFSLTPHNGGEYFTLSAEGRLKEKLYIGSNIFGLVRSKEQDKGDRAHIGITAFDEPTASTFAR